MSELVVVLSDAQLDALAERVAARLNGNGHAAEEPDALLTAREAAQKLGQKLRWIYGHRAQLPVVELPGRGLRFSERGIERLIKKRTTK
ncbi:MAG: hypothetical protein DMD33_17900 [Gemmatimonadetes bacterium]|nr:MAG: hypothetical protein DMD33_17900 [Gemmatimonadota bacterium]